VTIASTKGGLVFIAGCDPELVICIGEIQTGVVFGALETIKELRHQGESIAILGGDLIELAIIDAETERTIRFLDKEDGRTEGRLGGTDEAFRNHCIDVVFEGLQLCF
jgi:hypothetical protein